MRAHCLSCRPACCRWCRPISATWPAFRSTISGSNPGWRPLRRRRRALLTASVCLRSRLFHRLRRAGRRRLDHRATAAHLAGAAGHGCRRADHPDGPQLPRHPAHPAVCRARRASSSQGKPASNLAAYLMGLAFAFGWTPCIGPVLGPILTLAGGRETVAEGAATACRLFARARHPLPDRRLFSGAFMRFLSKFKVHLGKVEKVIGGAACGRRRAVPHRRRADGVLLAARALPGARPDWGSPIAAQIGLRIGANCQQC